MAKLEDADTKDKCPIIWIDDPISSLDNNHIFFVYSLINDKIATKKESFQQLFISTHNLSFLKYLKRLPRADKEIRDNNMKETNRQFRHLLIHRNENISDITLMPSYLKEYITEFNFLFEQIYQCASIEKITDANYHIFYNLGNNARKFLELFLYYKYPESIEDKTKYINFFGAEDQIPHLLIERVCNEYSHLAGTFERGEMPVETPEMQKAARFIIDKIKEHDNEQYEALLRSIKQ